MFLVLRLEVLLKNLLLCDTTMKDETTLKYIMYITVIEIIWLLAGIPVAVIFPWTQTYWIAGMFPSLYLIGILLIYLVVKTVEGDSF